MLVGNTSNIVEYMFSNCGRNSNKLLNGNVNSYSTNYNTSNRTTIEINLEIGRASCRERV